MWASGHDWTEVNGRSTRVGSCLVISDRRIAHSRRGRWRSYFIENSIADLRLAAVPTRREGRRGHGFIVSFVAGQDGSETVFEVDWGLADDPYGRLRKTLSRTKLLKPMPNEVGLFLSAVAAAKRIQAGLQVQPVSASVTGSSPAPRLLRSPRDAEPTVADWLAYWGYRQVRCTPIGPDAGIDVESEQALVQVKAELAPTGRPVVQQTYGVATAAGKAAMVFSLGGFTKEALDWAAAARVALFGFDLQGIPEPPNEPARDVLAAPRDD